MFRSIKKQTAFIILLLITLLATMSTAFATTYVGSVNSNKFHYTYCRYADRIYESNKIYFSSMKLLIVVIFLVKYAVHKQKGTR